MLKNIKSFYFTSIIFTYIKEVTKLKLIKYNKSLQKDLDISIINYKFFSGRYVIYESNLRKEYDAETDILLFEGEYLNGKRNGKGKEYYDSGRLQFEGEYINGKRNGKGEEFWGNGSIKFEGEYLNGERNGKGIEHWDNGYLRFEGEYLNGKEWIGTGYEDPSGNVLYKLNIAIDGNGKEYDRTGNLLFEGEYFNGKKNGKGKEYYDNGEDILKFEGEYLNDLKWNGRGYDLSNNLIYEIKEGKGLVKEYYYTSLIFEGQYINGQRNGKGREYWDDVHSIFI